MCCLRIETRCRELPHFLRAWYTKFMNSHLQQWFAAATGHHRSGRVTEAAELYRQIVSADPNHADSWHLWGITAQQMGQPALAVERIQRAIVLRPTDASFHANLGASLKSLQRLPEAI